MAERLRTHHVPVADIDKMTEDFQRLLQENEQTDEPSVEYMSFIPHAMRSHVLVMKAKEPTPPKNEDLLTVFIGTIRPNYTQEMWTTDVEKWKSHFSSTKVFEIPMIPINIKPYNKLNSGDAIPRILAVLGELSKLPPFDRIRLVCLGTGYAAFLYEAIVYIMKEWRDADGYPRKSIEKKMQFITSGDTRSNDLSNFCQWLCISGTCDEIEFINTQQYHPFGFCRLAYGGAA